MPKPKPGDRRIGLIGDAHGDVDFLASAVRALARRGVHECHQLGDYGIQLRGGSQAYYGAKYLVEHLHEVGSVLFVTLGNHEHFERLREAGVELAHARGEIAWLWPEIGVLPRGYRWRSETGCTLASLGGANSIDRYIRQARGAYWDERESITDADVERLGNEPVSVLLAHEAPRSSALLNRLARGGQWWGADGLAYAEEGRRRFMKAFRNVRPQLTVSGHYHFYLDTVDSYADTASCNFECRSVILDRENQPDSVAILDTGTLEVEIVDPAG